MDSYNHRDILKKYARNDLSGRTALIEGKPKVLLERPSQWSDAFSINLLFTSESENRIRAIADRIDLIGQKLGISFLLAGRDYPIHSALQAGWYNGEAHNRSDAYDRVYDGAFATADSLHGLHMEYKYLIMNPDSISLNADVIPSEIKAFRDDVVAIAKNEAVRPQNMDNILHVTLARFTDLPADEGLRTEALTKLQDELIALRHEISSAPITADVGRVFFGQVMDVPRER